MTCSVPFHPDPYEGNRVLLLKFDESYPSAHHLLFKAHKVDHPSPEKPNLRTLMLSNVPPWATSEAIKRIFQAANGPVENVILQSSPSSGPPLDDEASDGIGFRFG